MKKVRIATVGDNCMDVYDHEGCAYPGGNPVNVAVYIVRLGGESAYVGPVGKDRYGDLMTQAIGKKGVDVSHIQQNEGNTAITHVEIVNGDRVLGEYEEGVMADFKLTPEDISFLCSYDMVVSGIWGMVTGDLGKFRAAGVPVAFDFATKLDSPEAEAIFADVDYAFASMDEATDEEIKARMKQVSEKGPKLVVITRGEKGSIAYDGKEFYTYGIIPCEVVDTMGAGDSYIAGFLYALCEGKTVPEAMEKGAENSSITIAYSGAWEA